MAATTPVDEPGHLGRGAGRVGEAGHVGEAADERGEALGARPRGLEGEVGIFAEVRGGGGERLEHGAHGGGRVAHFMRHEADEAFVGGLLGAPHLVGQLLDEHERARVAPVEVRAAHEAQAPPAGRGERHRALARLGERRPEGRRQVGEARPFRRPPHEGGGGGIGKRHAPVEVGEEHADGDGPEDLFEQQLLLFEAHALALEPVGEGVEGAGEAVDSGADRGAQAQAQGAFLEQVRARLREPHACRERPHEPDADPE